MWEKYFKKDLVLLPCSSTPTHAHVIGSNNIPAKILDHHQLCHMQVGALAQFNDYGQPLVHAYGNGNIQSIGKEPLTSCLIQFDK
jgi:hypothetical protein